MQFGVKCLLKTTVDFDLHQTKTAIDDRHIIQCFAILY